MTGQPAAMHVARIRSGYTDKQGRRREYESSYLRRTYREAGKVRHETLANLSALPGQVVDAIESALKGTPLVPAGQAATITASVPHGHVAAVHAMAAKLGLPALLGPACAERDLALTWLEGRHCPLAARGYSRDGKKGKLQIEYGLLTDPHGRPVAVRVFPGNTGDPASFTEIVKVVRDKFKLEKMVMVGDRGMITSARIQALNTAEDGTELPGGAYGWVTALRAPAIKKLMADGGPLQLSLFDQQNLAEITSPDFPGERLIACRNPVLAADRARTRGELLAGTEKLLAPITARVRAGKLTGAGQIGVAVGKVITKYNTAKHFAITITDTTLTIERLQALIDGEAALDGFYVLRTPLPADQLDAPAVVTAYKNLKYAGRDFRHLKADDLDLRPIWHRLEERVKAHVLICMLGCYLTWHLRRAWAPLTFTDQDPPGGQDPVAPASRSAAAQAKASAQHDPAGRWGASFFPDCGSL